MGPARSRLSGRGHRWGRRACVGGAVRVRQSRTHAGKLARRTRNWGSHQGCSGRDRGRTPVGTGGSSTVGPLLPNSQRRSSHATRHSLRGCVLPEVRTPSPPPRSEPGAGFPRGAGVLRLFLPRGPTKILPRGGGGGGTAGVRGWGGRESLDPAGTFSGYGPKVVRRGRAVEKRERGEC